MGRLFSVSGAARFFYFVRRGVKTDGLPLAAFYGMIIKYGDSPHAKGRAACEHS